MAKCIRVPKSEGEPYRRGQFCLEEVCTDCFSKEELE